VGDLHGLATTFLLRGERDQAADYLGKLSTTPDVDSDRAVVALSKGALEEALILLEGVLEKTPNHPPALWNRGLVLRELGLELLAAESFGKVAALNEPGWSDEARERKTQLERQGLHRAKQMKEARLEVQLLRDLEQIARSQGSIALANAYLQEVALRKGAEPVP
jgi:tetratricopeptide (TPR) repeat protein